MFSDPTGQGRWEEIDGQVHWVGDVDGEYDKDLEATWVAVEGNPIGGYWDFGGDQSAVETPEPQNTIVVVGASGRVWEVTIFEPGIGGGPRNVSKSAHNLISRVASWLGFGKKAKRTIQVVQREDNLVEMVGTGARGEIRVLAEMTKQGDAIVLKGLHMEGASPGAIGIRELREFARQLGKEQGVH